MAEVQDKPQANNSPSVTGTDVLAELWITKATLNADANFDISTLTDRANETAQRLGFVNQ